MGCRLNVVKIFPHPTQPLKMETEFPVVQTYHKPLEEIRLNPASETNDNSVEKVYQDTVQFILQLIILLCLSVRVCCGLSNVDSLLTWEGARDFGLLSVECADMLYLLFRIIHKGFFSLLVSTLLSLYPKFQNYVSRSVIMLLFAALSFIGLVDKIVTSF